MGTDRGQRGAVAVFHGYFHQEKWLIRQWKTYTGWIGLKGESHVWYGPTLRQAWLWQPQITSTSVQNKKRKLRRRWRRRAFWSLSTLKCTTGKCSCVTTRWFLFLPIYFPWSYCFVLMYSNASHITPFIRRHTLCMNCLFVVWAVWWDLSLFAWMWAPCVSGPIGSN